MSAENLIIPTEALREKIRTYSKIHRDIRRSYKTDSLRFGLGEIQSKIAELDNLTEKDVQGLANRIKRRKHASAEDMYRLNHAFLNGIENIRAFARIPGAIQVLVKEFTELKGADTELQFYACETLCNLSLGEAPVCEKIASMAGSYLVTYLDYAEERIKRTCIWTCANIIATGGKGAVILMSMELVPTLIDLYQEEVIDCQEDYREDAAIALDVIFSSEQNLLRQFDLKYLLKKFHLKESTTPGAEYHLKIMFNSGAIAPGVSLAENQLTYLINFCLENLEETENFEGVPNRMRILYAVRLLANLVAIDPGYLTVLIEQCNSWNLDIAMVLNRLFEFKNEQLSSELLWLVKNIIDCQNHSLTAAYFSENLLIPEECVPTIQGTICSMS